MESIMFKKCKENIEMLNTTNQLFKEKYLLALNNIEENFSNYSSLKDLLQEIYKLSIYGIQQIVDPRMEENILINKNVKNVIYKWYGWISKGIEISKWIVNKYN